MYDGLSGRYTFRCPLAGEACVRLSRFRSLDRLAGTAHPAIYKVTFACPCGDDHHGLVTHEELDWAPLGAAAVAFFNVMTRRLEPSAADLVERAARRIGGGEWPWSFFCYPEGRSRPMFPSAFRLLAPAADSVGVAVRCPACARTSVNVVTARHVDEPFYNDRRVGVVEHIFEADREAMVAAFRAELDSSAFETRRRAL